MTSMPRFGRLQPTRIQSPGTVSSKKHGIVNVVHSDSSTCTLQPYTTPPMSAVDVTTTEAAIAKLDNQIDALTEREVSLVDRLNKLNTEIDKVGLDLCGEVGNLQGLMREALSPEMKVLFRLYESYAGINDKEVARLHTACGEQCAKHIDTIVRTYEAIVLFIASCQLAPSYVLGTHQELGQMIYAAGRDPNTIAVLDKKTNAILATPRIERDDDWVC